MIKKFYAGIARWLHEPVNTQSTRYFRVVFGFLCMTQIILIWPDLDMWLSNQGVLPPDVHALTISGYRFSLWILTGYSDAAITLIKAGGLVGSVMMITGYYPRVGAFISWLVLSSIAWRNMQILNSGDTLLRVGCFFLMFADTSRPRMDPWPKRMLQIQLCVVYLVTGTWKSLGTPWQNGTAVGTVLQLGEFQRFFIPDFLMTPLASKFLTAHTLIVELGFPLFVWVPILKVPVLAVGLLLHAGLEWSLNVQLFQWIIASFYILFLPDEWLSRIGRRGA